jgi:hypothetical protein
MKTIALAKALRPLAQYASELTDDILVVTEGDRPLAALISLKNVDPESLALGTRPEFMKILKRARREFDLGKTLSSDQMQTRVRRMRSPSSVLRPTTGTRRRSSSKRTRSTRRD